MKLYVVLKDKPKVFCKEDHCSPTAPSGVWVPKHPPCSLLRKNPTSFLFFNTW